MIFLQFKLRNQLPTYTLCDGRTMTQCAKLTCWQAIKTPKGNIGSTIELILEGLMPDVRLIDG